MLLLVLFVIAVINIAVVYPLMDHFGVWEPMPLLLVCWSLTSALLLLWLWCLFRFRTEKNRRLHQFLTQYHLGDHERVTFQVKKTPKKVTAAVTLASLYDFASAEITSGVQTCCKSLRSLHHHLKVCEKSMVSDVRTCISLRKQEDYFIKSAPVSVTANDTYLCHNPGSCSLGDYLDAYNVGTFALILFAAIFALKFLSFLSSTFKSPAMTRRRTLKFGAVEDERTTHTYFSASRVVILFVAFGTMVATFSALVYLNLPNSSALAQDLDFQNQVPYLNDEVGPLNSNFTRGVNSQPSTRDNATSHYPEVHDSPYFITFRHHSGIVTRNIKDYDHAERLLKVTVWCTKPNSSVLTDANALTHYDVTEDLNVRKLSLTGTFHRTISIRHNQLGCSRYIKQFRKRNAKIHPHCLTSEVVAMQKSGEYHCYEDSDGYIRYNPRIARLRSKVDELDRDDILLITAKGKTTRHDRFEFRNTHRMFLVDDGFKTLFTPSVYGNNNFWGGAITIGEDYLSDATTPPDFFGTWHFNHWHVFVHSQGRRQIISCGDAYWGLASQDGSFYECLPPIHPGEGFAARIPQWRNTLLDTSHIVVPSVTAGHRYLGKKWTSTINNRAGCIHGTDRVTSTATYEIMYHNSNQDNVQQHGSYKYFVYSAILKVTEADANFPSLMMNLNNDFDWYRSCVVTGSGLTRPTFEQRNSYFMCVHPPNFPDNCNLWTEALEVHNEACVECTRYHAPMDQFGTSMVLKFDLFTSEGQKVTVDNFSDMVNIKSYVVALYYAIRGYGPYHATVKYFGEAIEEIAIVNGVCKSVDAVKVRGVCYVSDWNYNSVEYMIDGYPLDHHTLTMNTKPPNRGAEIPSFIQFHPKLGSGQYLARVAATASIGSYSTNGPCRQVYYHIVDGAPRQYCDGHPAFEVPLVTYTTFVRPEIQSGECNLENHRLLCTYASPSVFKKCVTESNGTRSCARSVGTELVHDVRPNTEVMVRLGGYATHLYRGTTLHSHRVPAVLSDFYHRSPTMTVFLGTLLSLGYLALALLLLLIIFSAFSSQHFWLAIFPRNEICRHCGNPMYDDIQKQRHLWCKQLVCPQCVTVNSDGKPMCLKFSEQKQFERHAAIHRASRLCPLWGAINVRRTKATAFSILLLSSIKDANADFTRPSNLRSPYISKDLQYPPELFDCSFSTCTARGSMSAQVPILPNYNFTVTTHAENNNYKRVYTIEDPSISTSCVHLYSSMGVSLMESRTAYNCLGKRECGSEAQYLYSPLPNGVVPFDTVNPLRTYFCPKSSDCLQPIIAFTWLAAGCFTVNDGMAIGYAAYGPIVDGPLLHVFQCTIGKMSFDVCSGGACQKVGDNWEVQHGISFAGPTRPILPETFRVGVAARQGESAPYEYFYDMPTMFDAKNNPALGLTTSWIPQAKVCVEGMSYATGTCDISTSGSHPAVHCKTNASPLNIETLRTQYTPLTSTLQCNLDSSSLTWETRVEQREIMIDGRVYQDSQTVARPALDLSLKSCSVGEMSIDLYSDLTTTLDLVAFTGELQSISCAGAYNRNSFAMFTVSAVGEGLMAINCAGALTDTCVLNYPSVTTCNVTVPFPLVYTCAANNGVGVNVDCTQLQLIDPDTTSAVHIGDTNSDQLNTWPSIYSKLFSHWEFIIPIVILSLILVLVVVLMLCFCTRSTKLKLKTQ